MLSECELLSHVLLHCNVDQYEVQVCSIFSSFLWEVGDREERRGTLLLVRHCGSFVALLTHMEGRIGNLRMVFPL